MAKYYLDEPGLERLVAYIQDELSNKLNKNDQIALPEDLVHEADLSVYAKKSDIPEGQDLSEYAKAADFADVVREAALANLATKAELEDYATEDALESLRGEVTGVYHFRGSVADLEALQAIENPRAGDVYNLEDTGMNAAWTGEIWDEFGTIADLTDYMLKADVQAMSIPTVDSILYSGKSAVISDASGMQAMIANDKAEVEIVLAEDMTLADNLTIPAGKKVTLNLSDSKMSIASGKEITVRGELVIEGNEDGELDASQWGLTAYGEGAQITMNSGHLEAGEAPIAVEHGAKFVMNGGELEGRDNCPLMGQGSEGNGDVEIVLNGGKLIAHITSAGYLACGVYMPNNGKFIMNGGEIISDGAGLVMRAGEVELNGGSIVANGATGVKGKVGDSRVVVGPYAVVYDEKAKYPGASAGDFKLTIGANMNLAGTDGDVDFIFSDDMDAAAQTAYKAEHFIDNRA